MLYYGTKAKIFVYCIFRFRNSTFQELFLKVLRLVQLTRERIYKKVKNNNHNNDLQIKYREN